MQKLLNLGLDIPGADYRGTDSPKLHDGEEVREDGELEKALADANDRDETASAARAFTLPS